MDDALGSSTSRRSLLKLFGVGTAALILPSKDLVIPAKAVDEQDSDRYDQPVFITGDGVVVHNCVINAPVTIVGNHVTLRELVVHSPTTPAVNVDGRGTARALDATEAGWQALCREVMDDPRAISLAKDMSRKWERQQGDRTLIR